MSDLDRRLREFEGVTVPDQWALIRAGQPGRRTDHPAPQAGGPSRGTRLVATVVALAIGIGGTLVAVYAFRSSRPTGAAGPFAGLQWPAGTVRAGMLLYDDGTHLWDVSLDGTRELLWAHPTVSVHGVTAGPGGHQLAMVVSPIGANTLVYLYELTPDGQVRAVTSVRGDASYIYDPVFVNAPAEPRGPLRLYWVERRGDPPNGATSRLMTLGADGPVPVEVPLLSSYTLESLFAYPGAPTSSLLVTHPTGAGHSEVFRNNDLQASDVTSSPTLWASWVKSGTTRMSYFNLGVAWLTPTDYVVPILPGPSQSVRGSRLALDGFRVGGEPTPSRTVVTDSAISTYGDGWAPMIALDSRHILVISSRSALKGIKAASRLHSRSAGVPWLEVDVCTGKTTATGAMWHMDAAWTAVMPALPYSPTQTSLCGKA